MKIIKPILCSVLFLLTMVSISAQRSYLNNPEFNDFDAQISFNSWEDWHFPDGIYPFDYAFPPDGPIVISIPGPPLEERKTGEGDQQVGDFCVTPLDTLLPFIMTDSSENGILITKIQVFDSAFLVQDSLLLSEYENILKTPRLLKAEEKDTFEINFNTYLRRNFLEEDTCFEIGLTVVYQLIEEVKDTMITHDNGLSAYLIKDTIFSAPDTLSTTLMYCYCEQKTAIEPVENKDTKVSSGRASETTFFAQFQTYPNPTHDYITVEYTLKKTVTSQIFLSRTNGSMIPLLTNQTQKEGTYSYQLDLSHLPGGNYTLSLKAGGVLITRKIIIARL